MRKRQYLATCDHLTIRNLCGKVIVTQIADSKTVRIAISAHVKDFHINRRHDHHKGGNFVTLEGDFLIQQADPPCVTVQVGTGVELSIGQVIGSVQVGDISNNLHLRLFNDCEAQLGQVGSVEATVLGDSSLKVQGVHGTLKLLNSGNGSIHIASGDITNLIVESNGKGRIELGADCRVTGDSASFIATSGSIINAATITSNFIISKIYGTGEIKHIKKEGDNNA